MKNRKSSWSRETLTTVLYAILIALAFKTFAYEPFNIPSGSMIPTLLVGDYLFVSKFSYGYSRYSPPFFSLPLLRGRIFFSEPDVERGDVAVFKLPRDNKTDYIKRIVGLPGDRIQVVNGILHINGQAVKREQIDDFIVRDHFGNTLRIPRFIETLPNGRSHPILEEKGDNGSSDNTRVFTVPAGHYFAMGDNRDNSQDSRFIGFVPAENLVGRAEILFFSVDGDVWKFWKWARSLRFDRMFEGIR